MLSEPLVIFESASKPTPVLPPTVPFVVDATINDLPLKVNIVEEAFVEEVAKPKTLV